MKSKNILYILLTIWIFQSIFNVFYNSVKFVSEAKHLIPLSQEQNRTEIYGDIYNFLKFIETNTPKNSSVLIYSTDDKAYYLGRYVLTPRNISLNGQDYTFEGINPKFKYVASDKFMLTPGNFKKVTSVSGYMLFKRL